MKEGKNGVTANTPERILFGAGTIHKNLANAYELTSDTALNNAKTYYTRSGDAGSYVYTAVTEPNVSNIATYYENAWNFSASVAGATNGGSKFSVVPELYDVPVDGANVAVKGLKEKIGETATMEVNFTELSKDVIKAATLGEEAAASGVAGYDLIQSKDSIEEGDYWDNIAFVGKTLKGKNIIVIMENALCTSGIESEGKNKESATGAYTFTCHADLNADSFDKLPWKIYYPEATV